MSLNFTTLLPNTSPVVFPESRLRGLTDELVNNISKNILNRLPGGRRISEHGDQISCPILKINNTMVLMIPGWEGIPMNILVNIGISLMVLIPFAFLIRRVYNTEQQMRGQYISNQKSSDWIHFIYGKRDSNQSIIFTTKQINRDHPNAYLPVVLHEHRYLISDGDGNENGQDIDDLQNELYVRSTSRDNQTTQSDDNVSKTNDKPSDESSVAITVQKTEPLIPNEEQQNERLKSILWDQEIHCHRHNAIVESKPEPSTVRLKKWFTKYFLITDKAIISKRGLDAYHYLLFQRYIIYFVTTLTALCLLIILPINISGGRLENIEYTYYMRTTILNIRPDSRLIYVHSILTIIVVLMGIFLMLRFNRFVFKKVQNFDKRILFIENIPKIIRNSMDLKKYFEINFPNVVIRRVTFVYNIEKLTELLMNLWTSIEAKNFCRLYYIKYGQRCEVRPYCLGNFKGFLCCCYCFPKVDGLSFYTWEKLSLEVDIVEEVKRVTTNPERMVFVMFENEKMAELVYKQFRRQNYYSNCLLIWIHSIFGHKNDSVESWQWDVSYAPFPDDIGWLELHSTNLRVWALNISMNLLIFFTIIFVSTPASILRIAGLVTGYKSQDPMIVTDPLAVLFWQYMPTLVYLLMASVLPSLIGFLTSQIPFRTKSDYNHSIMYKSYIFLILMVLILPSLEILTVFTLFERELNVNNNGTDQPIRWNCLFPAENSAFFINYLLTSAFVGNVMEIARISELSHYFLVYLVYSRSPAEHLTARQMTKFDFYFGEYYAKILLLFTLIVTFSISSPLIAPIGLFYLVFKHLVDRYLIYHIYLPTKINQKIHSKAVLFVYFSLLFLLMQVYTHLAGMDDNLPSTLVGIALILYFFFTLFQFFWDIIYFL